MAKVLTITRTNEDYENAMKEEFYSIAKNYFKNNYSAYKAFCNPVYDDFIEELEALDVNNVDYGISDGTKDIFSVKKIDGKVTVKWNY